jgi:DNA replication protein DnaC
VIDEIGLRGRATDWQLESLLILLNARYKLPLIVTGNLTPEQVKEQYDGRIADRLCTAGTVVNLAGTSQRDWRPKGAK